MSKRDPGLQAIIGLNIYRSTDGYMFEFYDPLLGEMYITDDILDATRFVLELLVKFYD